MVGWFLCHSIDLEGGTIDVRRALRSQLTLLTLLGAALLVTVPAVAQDTQETPGTLSFVSVGSEPQTLLLESSDGARSGRLDVLLRNESKEEVTLDVEYVLTNSGRVLEVQSEAQSTPPTPEDPVRVNFVGDLPDIPSLETKKLSFSVSVAEGTQPSAAAGRLVVGAGPGQNVKPATMVINPVSTPPWRWQGVVVEPAAITINHINRRPGFLAGLAGGPDEGGRTVTVHGISADTLESANQTATLSSSTGGTARIALDPVSNQDPASPATGTLRVERIWGVGKYEGNLLLEPEASNSPKLAVTVSARDFLLWPLLTLLAGVLLAWALVWWRDTRRPKNLVLARIKEIHRTNEENTPDRNGPDPLYTYADLFPKPPDGYPGWWHWRQCKFVQKPRSARELYCNVMASRSKEELEITQKQVNDLASRVDLWRPTYEATKTLHLARDAAHREVPDPKRIPLLQATKELLQPRERGDLPTTVAEAETLLGKLKELTDALNLFVEGTKLKKEIQPLYVRLLAIEDRLKLDSERRELHESDPDAIYRAYLLPATSKAQITEGNALGRLRAAQYVLQRLKDAYQHQVSESLSRLASVPTPSGMEAAEIPSFLPALADRLRDTRTPESLRASVRVHDWVDFAVAALLASLAYLLALTYLGNFGTGQHYLAAFVAGASGSLAINWALLPWARSYIGGGSVGQPSQATTTATTSPSVK